MKEKHGRQDDKRLNEIEMVLMLDVGRRRQQESQRLVEQDEDADD